MQNYTIIIDTPQNRNIVSKILDLDPNTASWRILDADNLPTKPEITQFQKDFSDKVPSPGEELQFFDPDQTDLVLVHYNEGSGSKPTEYANIRGTIVSLKKQCIVAGTDNHGYTPHMVCQHLNSDLCLLTDTDGQEHCFDPKTAIFSRLFDGTFCRAFFWEGKRYLSIHKKIDVEKTGSSWCNSSVKFDQMFKNMGGDLEKLFPNNGKKFSNHCHYFILHHPDVIIANKNDLSDGGVLVYLGAEEMWTSNDQIDSEEVDFEIHEPDCGSDFISAQKEHLCLRSKHLSLDEANHHLYQGFFEHDGTINQVDSRLGTGEGIVARINHKGRQKVIRIHSPAYQWRMDMRQNDQNLYCRFVRNCTDALMDLDNEEFLESFEAKYPLLSFIPENSLRHEICEKNNKIIIWPQGIFNLDRYLSKNNSHPNPHQQKINALNAKIQLIWRCQLISCPLHMQKDVISYLGQFRKDKRDLINFIVQIAEKKIDPLDPKISERGKARQRINSIVSAAKNSPNNDLRRNISNLVHKEGFRIKREGTMNIRIKEENSLYQMITVMKRYYKLLEEENK